MMRPVMEEMVMMNNDNENLTGGNDSMEKKGSVFESEEAFERMMKRAIEKAVFALQVNKRRPKHGDVERLARKKATQKEKYEDDKSNQNKFCVSNT